jgi:hypothetical protein
MPGKSIAKSLIIEVMEDVSRNGSRVEWQTHGGSAGSNELGIHCRVMGERGAFFDVCVIKQFSEFVLSLVAASPRVQSPEVGVFGSNAQRAVCNAFANVSCALGGHVALQKFKNLEDAWASFYPG